MNDELDLDLPDTVLALVKKLEKKDAEIDMIKRSKKINKKPIRNDKYKFSKGKGKHNGTKRKGGNSNKKSS